MFDNELIDRNLDKVIVKCFINELSRYRNEVSVIYEDGVQEVIYHYNPMDYEYNFREFVGKTKIEVAFYCDKKPMISDRFGGRTMLFRK